jgi:serine protease AprX
MLGLLAAPSRSPAQAPVPAAGAARYWVRFQDKNGVAFEPAHYFSPAARARRQRQGLPAADFTDRPVRPDYLAAVQARVDTLTLVSRWFNAVACRATPAQAAALRQLPGVLAVEAWPVASHLRPAGHERITLKKPGSNHPRARQLARPPSPPPTTCWPASKRPPWAGPTCCAPACGARAYASRCST